MDPDAYVKFGLSAYFQSEKIRIMTASNISDLTVNLNNNKIDVVVMELFNREDNVFDCIDFVRMFPQKWPDSKLVIYTQVTNQEVVNLLISATGKKEIIFKNRSMFELTSYVFSHVKRAHLP
jgi:DNA-binding NarL/FixJ family response regulator